MPYDEERTYGPRVAVANGAPGIEWAVARTYAGNLRSPVLWRGMLTMFFMNAPFIDMEATLLESKDGSGSYVAWAQRSYKDNNGNDKYKNVVWVHDRNVAGAAADAVMQSMNPTVAKQGDDFDPLQDM